MEDPDQVKRKDYQTVLLTGLDPSWFQDREATKRDVLSVGVSVLEESCSDKDTGRALLKTATAPGSGQDIKSESGRVQATVIYKETSALSIDLRDPSYIPLLVKTAKHYAVELTQQSNRKFVISGNLDRLVDFRREFDEAIVSRGARESKTDPPLADSEASSAEHQDNEPGHGKGSSSLYPPSLYNSHPNHMPECLAIMNKVPQGKIPGVHYVPEEGMVCIDKSGDTNDAIARFSKEYQEVVKKMKMDRIDVPSRLSDAALKDLMEELDKKYSHIVFSVTSDPSSRTRQVKLVSISSRQFEPAKKLLSDRLNMLDKYVVPLGGSRHLTLKKDDIVSEDVEIIVNAANGRLQHAGGVAAAINKASGGAVQQHSNTLMRKRHNELKVGEVATTRAGGMLKCKHVIHAVGPTSSHHDSEGALKMVIRNILKEAIKLEAKCIAIPAISSGIYSVDKDLVARCILDVLFSYNYPKDAPVLSDIRVVIIDSPTYQCFASYLIQSKKIPLVKKVCSTDRAEARPDGKLDNRPDKITLEEAGSSADADDVKMEIETIVSKDEASAGVDECAKITTLLLPIASRCIELCYFLNKTGISITGVAGGDDTAKLQQVIQKWWETSEDARQKLETLIQVLGEMKLHYLAAEVWKEIPGGTGEGSRDREIAGTDDKPLTPYSTPTSEMPPGGFPAAVSHVTTSSDSPATSPLHKDSGPDQAESRLTFVEGGANHVVYDVGIDRGHVTGHVTRIDDVTREEGIASPPPGFTAGMGTFTLQGAAGRSPASTFAGVAATSSAPTASGHSMGGAQTTTVSSSGVSRMSSNAPTSTSAYLAEYPALTQHGRELVGFPSAQSSATAAHKPHEDVEICAMCWDAITDPETIPCGHKFCRGCLADYLQTGASCCPDPMCNKVFQPPVGVVTKDKDECPICLEDFTGTVVACTNCGYKFCKQCIQRLQQTSSCCTICKKSLQLVQVKGHQPPDGTTKKDKDECPICLQDFTNAITTTCGHKFCKKCIDRSLKSSSYCPTCKSVLRPLKGNQPPGTMNIDRVNWPLPGYKGSRQTLLIKYHIPDGIQGRDHPNPGKRYKGTKRTAYLPLTTEGLEVAELLKTAFNAGLVFTVGTSHTTGQSDVVVWNDIHHKTSSSAGQYGYPDATYLTRVKQDLAAKGIVPPPHNTARSRGSQNTTI